MGTPATRYRKLALAEAPSKDEGKPRVWKFRANDAEFDRYQDRLNVAGWKLDAFNQNPVILFNHDAGTGGCLGLGDKRTLPIGKGKAYVEGDALFVDVEFDQEDEFARKVEQKVAGGYLNAVSVRYVMAEGKFRDNEKGGVDSDEQELLEISVVTIPGNQRALRVKDLEGVEEQKLLSALADRIAPAFVEKLAPLVSAAVEKHLDERAKAASPAPVPVEAPTPAADLNASLTQFLKFMQSHPDALAGHIADQTADHLKEKFDG